MTKSVSERITEVKNENVELKNAIIKELEGKKDAEFLGAAKESQVEPLDIKCKQFFKYKGHFAKVAAVSWHQNSEQLLSASQDGTIIVWDANSGYKNGAFELASCWVLCCGFHVSGEHVFCGGLDNTVTVYKTSDMANASAQPSFEFHGHSGYISSIKSVSPQHIISSSGDKTVALWDLNQGKRVHLFSEGHRADVVGTSIVGESLFLAAVANGDVKLWDSRTCSSVATFPSLQKTTWCVETMPNNQTFAVGLDGGEIKLVDLRALQPLATFNLDADLQAAHSIAFSESGRVMFACCDKKLVALDVLTSKQTLVNEFKEKLSNVAISPKKQGILVGCWDNCSYLYV